MGTLRKDLHPDFENTQRMDLGQHLSFSVGDSLEGKLDRTNTDKADIHSASIYISAKVGTGTIERSEQSDILYSGEGVDEKWHVVISYKDRSTEGKTETIVGLMGRLWGDKYEILIPNLVNNNTTYSQYGILSVSENKGRNIVQKKLQRIKTRESLITNARTVNQTLWLGELRPGKFISGSYFDNDGRMIGFSTQLRIHKVLDFNKFLVYEGENPRYITFSLGAKEFRITFMQDNVINSFRLNIVDIHDNTDDLEPL